MNVTLDAANPDDLAGFAFRPPSLVIEPGTAAFSRLVVAPRRRFLAGRASGRLQIGDDQQPVSYTVPDGRRLELTDFVLQNPEGDTGVLRVTAGDETLFVVRLENFRDVDYHFVVPIVVGEGKKLSIAVQCQNPDPAKRCSPAALFSGNLVSA